MGWIELGLGSDEHIMYVIYVCLTWHSPPPGLTWRSCPCSDRYGSYDKSISVARNVNLPDSLLSRFDMLFVVLDCMNEARDRQVCAGMGWGR